MKDLKDIEKEIREAELDICQNDGLPSEKRYRKRLAHLKQMRSYLKSNPSEEFLYSEKERLNGRISSIMKLFKPLDPEKIPKPECTKHRKEFEKQWELPKLRKQASVIHYLIN